MKRNLIIFTYGGGRLANQLTNFSHLFAFWKENDNVFDIINIAFWEYASLFISTKDNKFCTLPFNNYRLRVQLSFIKFISFIVEKYRHRILNQFVRIIHLIFHLMPNTQSLLIGEVPSYLKYLNGNLVKEFDLESEESIDLLKSKKISALSGWPIRNWTLFVKYEDEIRNLFKVVDPYNKNACKFISELRNQYDMLVGVFIRQTDYKIWADGRYFFPADQYLKWIKQVEAIFSGNKVCFVVASDEALLIENNAGVNFKYTTGSRGENGHFIESLVELSMCNLIMTPPSTFGVWASFLGKVTLIPLFEKEQFISKESFLYNNIFDAIRHPHLSKAVK